MRLPSFSSKRKKIQGFVEQVGPSVISGWAFDKSGAPVTLILQVGGETLQLAAVWSERADVAKVHGHRAASAGFACELSAAEMRLLEQGLRGPRPPRVLANGAELDFAATALPSATAGRPTTAGLKGAAEPTAQIERIEHFRIHGWIEEPADASATLGLLVGNREMACTPIRHARKQASGATSKPERIQFEIELPGYLWEEVPQGAPASIRLTANGKLLSQKDVEVARADAVRWIDEIANLHDGNDRQYLALVALEHVRHGELLELLPEGTARFVADFAGRMKLADYLPASAVPAEQMQFAQSFTQLAHWSALRLLNERLGECSTSQEIFSAVVGVMREYQLDGEAMDLYLDSVVPLLCRHDTFSRLREVTDLARWHRLENVEDAWSLTTALPALLADGHVARATSVLWSLGRCLDGNWINTECINFAVREVNRRLLSGKLEAGLAEKFGYAVMGLFDAFRGEWFSRLHDLELIHSAVALIDALDIHTDYFRRDVVLALIRNFAIMPEFWQALDAAHPALGDADLDHARSQWQSLRQALNGGDNRESADALARALRYFRRQKNPEAAIILREVVMNRVARAQLDDRLGDEQDLVEMLLEDQREGVRLAACPLVSAAMLASYPETSANLLQGLRALSPRPRSVHYQIQSEAGHLIRSLQKGREGDVTIDRAAVLGGLRRHALALHNWPAQYLSIDLLTWYILQEDGRPKTVQLNLLSLALKRVVDESRQDWFLPASTLAALSRLQRLAISDSAVRSFLLEIQQYVAPKFGDKHEFLFEAPARIAMPVQEECLHGDTLVVVYSCRKYLETRIAAIRKSWVQDLKARGIPYLIMVGDGDDTVNGDLLALDVSDRYEDLPKKTLKLVDWVLENTTFQYLYKIDDDCYLDAERFFDTLSYRKHHYYGRLIERQVGSMDRAWHQSKSQTEHAQKVLDKSPEPASYADGGGGYVLSRLAMHMVRENARSEYGQRLMAVSLMEDKLIGDLLAISHVRPNNEDYESYQRRRTFGNAEPVGMWENTFFPGMNTPTMMTHLDTDRDMAWVQDHRKDASLWPKKIWPTTSAPLINLKWMQTGTIGSNQLELLCTRDKLLNLLASPLMLVAVVRNEMTMLPHFLAHYRKLGVSGFFVVDNVSDDGTREYLLDQPDVAVFSADTEYKHSHYGVAWQQAVLGNFCQGKWVLLADADELLVYPDCETATIHDFIALAEQQGADCVRIDMIDMYPYDDLADADLGVRPPFEAAPWFDAHPVTEWRLSTGWFSNSSNGVSALRHRIDRAAEPSAFVSQKYALLRYQPWMRISQGVHYLAGAHKIASSHGWFAHFKYHAGFKEKVETEVHRNQHYDNAKEYRRYAAILAESRGGFGAVGTSRRYVDSRSFLREDEA